MKTKHLVITFKHNIYKYFQLTYFSFFVQGGKKANWLKEE